MKVREKDSLFGHQRNDKDIMKSSWGKKEISSNEIAANQRKSIDQIALWIKY